MSVVGTVSVPGRAAGRSACLAAVDVVAELNALIVKAAPNTIRIVANNVRVSLRMRNHLFGAFRQYAVWLKLVLLRLRIAG